MGMAVANAEANGQHGVDEFNDKAVFGDAERSNGGRVSLLINGVEGSRW